MERLLIPLNLPPFQWDLRRSDSRLHIFDIVRQQYVLLTPEEWVRQHFVHYLIGEGYPKGLISIEKGLSYNKRQKRTDLWAADKHGSPFLLVECKAPHVALDHNVLLQAATYNQTLKAPFMALTNGLAHAYFRCEGGKGPYTPIDSLPLLAK